jgi:hypothetical protein
VTCIKSDLRNFVANEIISVFCRFQENETQPRYEEVFKTCETGADISVTPSGRYYINEDGWHQFILIYKQLLI